MSRRSGSGYAGRPVRPSIVVDFARLLEAQGAEGCGVRIAQATNSPTLAHPYSGALARTPESGYNGYRQAGAHTGLCGALCQSKPRTLAGSLAVARGRIALVAKTIIWFLGIALSISLLGIVLATLVVWFVLGWSTTDGVAEAIFWTAFIVCGLLFIHYSQTRLWVNRRRGADQVCQLSVCVVVAPGARGGNHGRDIHPPGNGLPAGLARSRDHWAALVGGEGSLTSASGGRVDPAPCGTGCARRWDLNRVLSLWAPRRAMRQ